MNYYENELIRHRLHCKIANAIVNRDLKFLNRLRKHAATDFFFWHENFVWGLDPRKSNSITPFLLYDFQKDLAKQIINSIKTGQDIHISKARDMGVTCITMNILLWYWLFHGPGNNFLVGSRKEAYVDRRFDDSTLFEKLRFTLYKMPKIFMPTDFNKLAHDTYMKLTNPYNGNTIVGESSNKYFSTGARKKAVIFDEFSKWDNDESAWQSASDVTKCKIAISSANGTNNEFYRLLDSDIQKVRLPYNLHPDKTKEWLAKERTRRSAMDIEAEVLINFHASVRNRACVNFDYDTHVGDYNVVSDHPIEINWDFNVSPLACCICQTFFDKRYTVDEYFEYNTTTADVIAMFINDYRDHKDKRITIYGDYSGGARHTTGRWSNYDIIERELENAGWSVDNRVEPNPLHSARHNIINKRLKDWARKDMNHEFIDRKAKEVINSMEQTEFENNNFIKNGKEHMLDAWSAKLYVEYGNEIS